MSEATGKGNPLANSEEFSEEPGKPLLSGSQRETTNNSVGSGKCGEKIVDSSASTPGTHQDNVSKGGIELQASIGDGVAFPQQKHEKDVRDGALAQNLDKVGDIDGDLAALNVKSKRKRSGYGKGKRTSKSKGYASGDVQNIGSAMEKVDDETNPAASLAGRAEGSVESREMTNTVREKSADNDTNNLPSWVVTEEDKALYTSITDRMALVQKMKLRTEYLEKIAELERKRDKAIEEAQQKIAELEAEKKQEMKELDLEREELTREVKERQKFLDTNRDRLKKKVDDKLSKCRACELAVNMVSHMDDRTIVQVAPIVSRAVSQLNVELSEDIPERNLLDKRMNFQSVDKPVRIGSLDPWRRELELIRTFLVPQFSGEAFLMGVDCLGQERIILSGTNRDTNDAILSVFALSGEPVDDLEKQLRSAVIFNPHVISLKKHQKVVIGRGNGLSAVDDKLGQVNDYITMTGTIRCLGYDHFRDQIIVGMEDRTEIDFYAASNFKYCRTVKPDVQCSPAVSVSAYGYLGSIIVCDGTKTAIKIDRYGSVVMEFSPPNGATKFYPRRVCLNSLRYTFILWFALQGDSWQHILMMYSRDGEVVMQVVVDQDATAMTVTQTNDGRERLVIGTQSTGTIYVYEVVYSKDHLPNSGALEQSGE